MIDGEKPRGSWLALLLMAIGTLIVLTILVILTLGQMFLVLLIVGGIFGLAAFHYLVWGWWLSRMIRDEEQSDVPVPLEKQWPEGRDGRSDRPQQSR